MKTEKDLDKTAAEAYEKFITPTFMLEMGKSALNAAAPRPGERVLDIACGTGLVARLAAPLVAPGGTICSLDFDPAMISVARGIVGEGKGANLSWHCASAQEMPFGDGEFDLVICLHGLQFLPDPAAGLAEMRRVMRPGARLVVTVWSAIERCVGHHIMLGGLGRRGVDATPMLKAFWLGDSGKLKAMADAAGFLGVGVRAEGGRVRVPSGRHFVESLAAGAVATRHAMARLPENQRAEFLDEMDEQFRAHAEGGGVATPFEQLVLTARAG